MSSPPLTDITVIDFSHIRAGPWCTQILGELGAEVIKVERPDVGDKTRHSHPEQGGMGVNFIARNRNKKSIVIDLKTVEGVAIAEGLLADADVLVENFGPGVLDRLGLGYEHLAATVNPRLVYTAIRGYGDAGPYREKKGVDLIMQAEGGLMSVTGPEGGPPTKVGQSIADIGAGLYAIIGTLTALHQRERTGRGQKVETNLFGTVVSFMEEYLTMYGITGEDPEPIGNRHQNLVPLEVFETADGHIALHTPSRQWPFLVTEVIGDESLLAYSSDRDRIEHYDEIMAAMRPVMCERSTAAWIEFFDEHGFPCGPINRVSDVIEHPQARDRGYVIEYDDPTVGEVTLHGHPLHFSEAETGIWSGFPSLGQHTDEVLSDRLNLAPAEIDRLRKAGVVA